MQWRVSMKIFTRTLPEPGQTVNVPGQCPILIPFALLNETSRVMHPAK